MDENILTCPACRNSFFNGPPYRQTSRTFKDKIKCPYCGFESTSSAPFLRNKKEEKPAETGNGIQLTQGGPKPLTPSQIRLMELQQLAKTADSNNMFKLADRIELEIKNYLNNKT